MQKLIEKGKRLFLATNSHLEYADLIMSQTLGDDWRTLFDLSVVNAQKPGFFKKNNSPFYEIDQNATTLKGKSIT